MVQFASYLRRVLCKTRLIFSADNNLREQPTSSSPVISFTKYCDFKRQYLIFFERTSDYRIPEKFVYCTNIRFRFNFMINVCEATDHAVLTDLLQNISVYIF